MPLPPSLQANPNELTNGVINSAFMLLFKDSIRLFAAYNEGVINLLGKDWSRVRFKASWVRTIGTGGCYHGIIEWFIGILLVLSYSYYVGSSRA